MADRILTLPAMLVGLALAGCAGAGRSPLATQAVQPAGIWGDRTIAVVAPKSEPTLAYFAPGKGGGALYVWDAGEEAIVRGDWLMDGGGRVCPSLDVSYRAVGGALRSARPACFAPDRSFAGVSVPGDAFQLNGKSDVPYVLSSADNERLSAVLAEARRSGP